MAQSVKIIEGGKLVIPAAMRRKMGVEPGDTVVVELLPNGELRVRSLAAPPDWVINAVNLSEVVAKLSDRGGGADAIEAALNALDLDVVAFDREQARFPGLPRAPTRALGLSLDDRA